VQRRLYESYISENNFRDFIRVNMEEVIHLRERGLVLDRIRLSSRRNTTEPLLLESVKKIDQWLEFPLSNLGLGKFEFELEKIGFWGMNVNRQIKDGIAKEFLWFLDKVDRENIRGKEQWEEAILRTAWELELLGDNKSEVQIMFRRELKTRGYNVERIESVLKEIPLSATKPQGEAIPLLKRTVQEIREWDVYNVTGRNWYWDFWPPGRRQIIKDRLEILLEKDHFVQFVKELAAKLYPSSEVRAIIVGGSYLYGYTELKGRDIDSTVILSNSTGNAPEFAHQLFTKDSLDKLNLASRFSLPEDYLRKVTDFDFIFRTEQGIRDQDLAYLWGSGITIYGEDFADRKPDQRILLRDALHLLENGIKKMWDYPMAPKSDVDYMFGKIVKRLTEASFELKQLFPDEASQLSNADYYPQLVTSYYQALIEQKGKDREDRKIEKEFLRGIASTYMQRLDYIKTKIDAITDPDERWDDYISMAHIIRGIDRVSNYGDHDTLPVLYQDIHGLMKSMTGNRLKEAVQDKTQDNAMATVPLRKTGAIRDTGGIDLTPANMNLQTQNNGGAIKFHLDPAILQQLQNASGFVPVIINIQPMNNLKMFLGLADN
jgi:hypothetical protein